MFAMLAMKKQIITHCKNSINNLTKNNLSNDLKYKPQVKMIKNVLLAIKQLQVNHSILVTIANIKLVKIVLMIIKQM